ncbi:hypothetical protein DPMN_137532 [Dreissena polymorpha]|uniref:Uncharacterized protein n=1 Tax=Dreissena polymorpha TaxID=45954 RepID=A0A9D4G5F7_DREPO|nr:hypothetical protein DPMN_137532 [Dreissena polymorpha]
MHLTALWQSMVDMMVPTPTQTMRGRVSTMKLSETISASLLRYSHSSSCTHCSCKIVLTEKYKQWTQNFRSACHQMRIDSTTL